MTCSIADNGLRLCTRGFELNPPNWDFSFNSNYHANVAARNSSLIFMYISAFARFRTNWVLREYCAQAISAEHTLNSQAHSIRSERRLTH